MYLSSHRLTHGEQKVLARTLCCSTRTLRAWRDEGGRCGDPGRPPHSDQARHAAREQVERAWRTLPSGYDGWRSVCALLERQGIRVPTRLVQESLTALKRDHTARTRARIARRRVHVDVLARDALWALDQTHLLRDGEGKLKALVVRECIVPHTLGLSIGPPAGGEDVVRLLEKVAEERGAWPLVVQMDNGPENRNARVKTLLDYNRVIALWNEPRTPQHNARVERTIESLKQAGKLTKRAGNKEKAQYSAQSGDVATRGSVCARLFQAWARLDDRTPRFELDGLTPTELDRIAPRAEDRVSRARFYLDVCEALRRASLAPIGGRARRKQEREVIWNALQRYGLVQRTRDGRLLSSLKEEGVS